MPFPYTAILKRAYDLTRNNFQVWVFGIFLSFASGPNFLLTNIILNSRDLVHFQPAAEFEKFRNFVDSPWAALYLGIVLLIIFLSALSKASVIWAGQKLAQKEQSWANEPAQFSVKAALSQGSRFVWPVFRIEVLLLFLFLVFVAALLLPVVYLLNAGETGRSIALIFLGLAIFVPVSVLWVFTFLYSPIFAVLYKVSSRMALGLGFQLTQTKMKESLIMGAFLAGILLLFIAALGFGIIVISVPVAFLSLVLAKLGLSWAIYLLVFATGFIGLCATIILSAGLAIFNNFVWVLTVMELVKTEKTAEPAKVLAPEAEGAA